jgi:hypothetical protein
MALLGAVHKYLGLAFMFATAVLAVWGYLCHRRRQPLPQPYWHALRGCAAVLAVVILLGLGLLLGGRRPPDPLHFMYAGLVTLGIAISELLRPRASLGRILREEGRFSEAGAYALLTAVVSLLTLRLWMTG